MDRAHRPAGQSRHGVLQARRHRGHAADRRPHDGHAGARRHRHRRAADDLDARRPIGNAIFNAIGVRVPHAPFTPERVLAALAEKGGK